MLTEDRFAPAISARLGISSDPVLPTGAASTSSSPPPAGSRSSRYHRKGHSRPQSTDSLSASQPASRAASPLRFLPTLLHRIQSRDEPFVPIDPFSFPWHFHRRRASNDLDASDDLETHIWCGCLVMPICGASRKGGVSRLGAAHELAQAYVTDVAPRQIYLHILLRLPSLYWSRVCRIFEDAEVTKAEMQRMIDAACARGPSAFGAAGARTREGVPAAGAGTGPGGETDEQPSSRQISRLLPFPEEWTPPNVSPAMARFKHSWEAFVDSVMREWKTLNVLSALLLSCVGFFCSSVLGGGG